jgi:hypothetical protein
MGLFIGNLRFFKKPWKMVELALIAATLFLSAAETAPPDSSAPRESLPSLRATLIKEAVDGRSYLYPSFQQREEDLFTSKTFYALAKRPPKKGGATEPVALFDLFDLSGKKRCSVTIDENFSGASLSDVAWFAVSKILDRKVGLRQCTVYDQACNAMAQIRYLGASMLISPSGDYGTVSGCDLTSGSADFRIYCFRKNNVINTVPVKNAIFLGAQFCSDNSVVTLWNEKRDSVSGITVAKYDATSGELLKMAAVVDEMGRPLTSPGCELLHFEASPNRGLFAFFAVNDRYCLTAQQSVANTTVVFDQNLRIKLFSSDRIHRTVKVVDDNIVAVGTWFDAKMFSMQKTGVPVADEKIELFDFIHEKAIGETEGVASPLIGAVSTQDEIYCIFEVNTVFLTFNRSLQKFTRLWQENAGGMPVAAVGGKIIGYSFSARRYIGF